MNAEEFKKASESEDFKKALEEVLTSIANQPVEAPKLYYRFPKDPANFNLSELFEWFRAMELYSTTAEHYEKQERGMTCHVDRAGRDWVVPRLKEFLVYIKGK